MFKGAFQAFKELNKSVNGRDHSLWKSRDDLSESSADQSSGNSSFLDKDLQEQAGLREEIKADDREDMKYEEGFPASPIPAKPIVPTKSVVDSWPLDSTPTKPGRERTKQEEVSPASSVPNKLVRMPPFPSPTPTKSTTPAKSPSDDWPSPNPTEQDITSPNLTFTRSASTTVFSEDEPNTEDTSMDLDPSALKSDPQEKTATKLHFKGYINGVATFREESSPPLHTGNDSTPPNKNGSFPQDKSVRKMSSTTSFLKKMAALSKPESNNRSPPTPSTSRPLTKDVPSDPGNPREQESNHPSPRQAQDHQESEPNRSRRRQNTSFAMLQPIVESTTFIPKPAVSPTPFGSSLYGVDSTFAQKMEEAGRLRRLQSQSQMDLRADNTSPTPATKSHKHAKFSSEGMERTSSSSGSTPHILEDLSNTWRQEMRHTVVPPATPPKTPSKISPTVSHSEQDSPRTANSQTAELQALRDQLARAMHDKQLFERELARVTTQSTSDRERSVRELRTLKQDNSVLAGQVDQLTRRNDVMNSELKRTQTELRKLTAEKRGWQEQLDTMHHKVVQAERQIRCLDHLTRAKLEARAEAVHGPPKRTKLALSQTRSSEEVIRAIADLNEEILQAANLLIENLDRTRFYGSITEASNMAEKVVGAHATEMLKAQSGTSTTGFRQLLMLVVMEVFLVHWCSAIIEGFYPKRPSFADLLVELSSHTTTTTTTAIGCGKQFKVVENQSSATIAVQFPTWASEIIRDLADILLVGGLKIRPKRQEVFKNKIQSIIALAYDLRAALAEKDICGGVELVVVSPDSPFQPKWMEEGHTTERQGTAAMLTQMEAIAGTTGIGLKRLKVGGTESEAYTYPLKPKVVLARVLRESLA